MIMQITCSVSPTSRLGKFLQSATLIVWDDSEQRHPSHRTNIEAFDRPLRDLAPMESPLRKQPFGGKVVVRSLVETYGKRYLWFPKIPHPI